MANELEEEKKLAKNAEEDAALATAPAPTELNQGPVDPEITPTPGGPSGGLPTTEAPHYSPGQNLADVIPYNKGGDYPGKPFGLSSIVNPLVTLGTMGLIAPGRAETRYNEQLQAATIPSLGAGVAQRANTDLNADQYRRHMIDLGYPPNEVDRHVGEWLTASKLADTADAQVRGATAIGRQPFAQRVGATGAEAEIATKQAVAGDQNNLATQAAAAARLNNPQLEALRANKAIYADADTAENRTLAQATARQVEIKKQKDLADEEAISEQEKHDLQGARLQKAKAAKEQAQSDYQALLTRATYLRDHPELAAQAVGNQINPPFDLTRGTVRFNPDGSVAAANPISVDTVKTGEDKMGRPIYKAVPVSGYGNYIPGQPLGIAPSAPMGYGAPSAAVPGVISIPRPKLGPN